MSFPPTLTETAPVNAALVATMVGAIATNLLLGQSPLPPAILLLVAAAVVWTRRRQLFASRATQ